MLTVSIKSPHGEHLHVFNPCGRERQESHHVFIKKYISGKLAEWGVGVHIELNLLHGHLPPECCEQLLLRETTKGRELTLE